MPDKTLVSTFMEEGKCARCGEYEPRIFAKFYNRNNSPELATTLGFCSRSCKNAFCAGIKALSMGV